MRAREHVARRLGFKLSCPGVFLHGLGELLTLLGFSFHSFPARVDVISGIRIRADILITHLCVQLGKFTNLIFNAHYGDWHYYLDFINVEMEIQSGMAGT